MIRPVAFGALSCALALASSVPLTARAESREVRKAVPAHDGFVVEVENLAGTMRLEAASGTDVEVVARLHAEGNGDAETKKLLSQLDVDFESTPGRLTARARYPVDEVRTIRYPDPRRRDEDHGFLSFLNASRSTVKYQGRRVTVVSGR